MWKFEIFAATQILREITYAYFEASKITILTILAVLNFDIWTFLPFSNMKFSKNQNCRAYKIVKNAIFHTVYPAKCDFT